jgi:hypothetical protein
LASKYRKGEPYISVIDVIECILDGRPLYWNHKVQTAGWMWSQRLTTLYWATERGEFARALWKVEDHEGA